MTRTKITIIPKRSLVLYALLAIVMVIASYVVIVALAVACVYLPCLAITEIKSAPFQLVVLLIGGLVVAGAMLWSLVPRREKFEAPGLLLERSEHPRLFREIDEIAATLSEPVPREVYLIGQVNAFVADRGGMLGFGTRRILAIGLPLLSILNVSEIRGILAHEFAHYYSGDTRMGPWVYRAQTAMIRTFRNVDSVGGKIGRHGLVVLMYFVVAFVLKWNFLFFLRVTNFVSRKKEFRADELACLVAGRKAVADGLRKTHGAALAWQEYWNTEVAPVLQRGCIPPIGGGLAQFLAAPLIAEQVARGIEQELAEGKTNPYETHPPLRDRLAAIRTIAVEARNQSEEPAMSLLNDPESTELRFLEGANPHLPKGELRRVNWDEVGPLVTIPAWQSSVRDYVALLDGIRAESLPEAVKNLPAIGSRIPDPKGMLLTPEQRKQRAGHLLAVALGLALLEKGWQLEAQPGNFYLYRGSERLDVFALLKDLAAGKIPQESWRKRCEEWGIAGASLSKSNGVARTEA